MSTFQPYAAMPFYPGPVSVHPAVAAVLAKDYAPPRMGTEYLELYRSVSTRLQTLLGTKEDVIIGTGEGMLVLWGALKSLLKPGNVVLSVGTGVFGDGFGDMAGDPLQMYFMDIFTLSLNLAGLPGLSIPVGMSGKLPVGLQLMGRAFDEGRLFLVGDKLTRALGTHNQYAPL